MAAGGLFQSIAGLNQVAERDGLLWVDPERSIVLCCYHLRLDEVQSYPNARTGVATPPGSWSPDPYWIGKWARAGYAVMVDLQSAAHDPPYRIFLAADPFYVAKLAAASNVPRLYGIVDSDPEVAAAASAQLGYSGAGYGLVGAPREPGYPSFPVSPQLPGSPSLPSLPAIPLPPGGYLPAPSPPPVEPAPARPEPTVAAAPAWLLPAAGAAVGIALLWLLRSSGRK